MSMERAVTTVKRPYNSSRRQEQAQRNRDAVLDAAQHRFLTDGYAATTIATIAEAAHVSAETIYKAFGAKAGLVPPLDPSNDGRAAAGLMSRAVLLLARRQDHGRQCNVGVG